MCVQDTTKADLSGDSVERCVIFTSIAIGTSIITGTIIRTGTRSISKFLYAQLHPVPLWKDVLSSSASTNAGTSRSSNRF